MDLLDASPRVAFAALLHDLGKFAERACLEAGDETLETHQRLYCSATIVVPGFKTVV